MQLLLIVFCAHKYLLLYGAPTTRVPIDEESFLKLKQSPPRKRMIVKRFALTNDAIEELDWVIDRSID